MEGPERCPNCSEALPVDAPAGLCARCVVEQMLAGLDEDDGGHDDVLGGLGATRIGDYELIERIAQGGMGVVYKARQAGLDRPVALKLILEGKLAAKQDLERFLLEARAAAELEHPHIVPIYEVGEDAGQYFFSMRLVEGSDFDSLIRDASLSRESQAAFIKTLVKVARAVDYAHGRGIIHRDLKPSNILLDADGEPQISDFGLAKKLDDDSHLTRSGQVMGSPAYMAPEQGRGEKELTPAADTYSLGVMLYEALTGSVPYEAASPIETLQMAASKEPVPPRKHNPKTDRDLDTICLKCLEKSPADRYGSASQFADDLELWLENKPITAKPPPVTRRFKKWVQRKPAQAALIAVAILSAGGFMIYKTHRDAESEEERRNRYVSDVKLASESISEGDLGRARELLQRYAKESEDPPPFEVRLLWNQARPGPSLRIPLQKRGEITGLAAVSGSQSEIAVSYRGGSIGVWDYDTGKEVRKLSGLPVSIGSVNGGGFRLLLQESGASTVASLVAFKPAPSAGRLPNSIFKAPDAKLAALAGRAKVIATVSDLTGTTATVWKPPWTSGTTVDLGLGSALDHLCLSPSGKQLAACRSDRVQIIALDGNREDSFFLPARHKGRLASACFSPNEALIATGGTDGRVHIWTIGARKVVSSYDFGVPVRSVAFLGNDRIAAAGDSGLVKRWSFPPVARAWRSPGNQLGKLLAGSADGRFLAGTIAVVPHDAVDVIEIGKPSMPAIRIPVGTPPIAMHVTSSSLRCVGKRDQDSGLVVSRWNLDPPAPVGTADLADSEARDCLAGLISEDGATFFAVLASGKDASDQHELMRWNLSSGTLERSVRLSMNSGDDPILAISEKRKTLLLARKNGNEVDGFDVTTLERGEGFPLQFSSERILHVCTDLSSSIVAVTLSDGAIRLRDLSGDGTDAARLSEPQSRMAVFAPDGKTIVSADPESGSLHVWNVAGGVHLFDLSVTEPLPTLFFNRRGDVLIGQSTSGVIYIWRAPFTD